VTGRIASRFDCHDHRNRRVYLRITILFSIPSRTSLRHRSSKILSRQI
jgi:hypothetical protein